jgi:hypothetical protein
LVVRVCGETLRLFGKRGDEARLSAWIVDVVDWPGAGSFEPESWSTLLTTHRVAVIGVSRF